jgi:hypothetical protein
MCRQIKFLFILSLLLFQTGMLSSQCQTDITKLETGKNYKIVLIDGSEITGRFIKTDSMFVKIEQANKSIDLIPANDINYFTANLAPEKYKFSVSLTGGASFLLGKYYPYEGTPGNKICPDLNISCMLFFSDSKAVKVDAGFTSFRADNNVSPTTVYWSITGGNMMRYSFKASFVLGSFKPDKRFMFYGVLGFGVHFAARDAITLKYNLLLDSTQHVLTDVTEPTIWINPIISAGGAVGYRFSKHFGVNAEVEYIMILGSGESMFMGKPNYFPLRAGLFYIF